MVAQNYVFDKGLIFLERNIQMPYLVEVLLEIG